MSESELFEYLKRYWSDLKMSKDQYSKHDCFSQSTKTRIELKCRKKHYDDLMLERSKYVYLMIKHILYEEIPLYINYTPKGIYCFEFNKDDIVRSEILKFIVNKIENIPKIKNI